MNFMPTFHKPFQKTSPAPGGTITNKQVDQRVKTASLKPTTVEACRFVFVWLWVVR